MGRDVCCTIDSNLRTLSIHSSPLLSSLPTSPFTGTIPEEAYSLVALTYLSLSYSKTEGFLPDMIPKLQKLPLLQVLGLGKGTSGTIPEGIGALVALTYLDLGSTSIEGTLPGDDLAKLVNLQTLGLHGTKLSGGSEEKCPLRVVTFSG